MLNDVPEGWKAVCYQDICDINVASLSSSIEPDQDIHYLDISCVPAPGVIVAPRALKFGDAPSRARRIVRSNDILLSTVRPYLRSFAFVPNAIDDLIASTGFAVLSPKPNTAPEFIYQTVYRDNFLHFLEERMTGSNYPAVNASDIAVAPVPLPPLAEQRKIAAILSSVDGAIQATEAVIAQTRRVKEGLLQELLTKGIGHTRFKKTAIGEIPETWEVKTLAGVIKRVIDNRGKTPPVLSEGPHELLEGNSLTEVSSTPDYSRVNKFVSQQTYDSWFRAGHPQKGDVLLPTVGAIGRAVYLDADRGCIAQNIIGVRPSNSCNPPFLFYWFSSSFFRDQTARVVMNAAQPSLRVPHMLKYNLAVPPKAEQEAIARPLISLDKCISNCKAELDQLQQTKAGLLQDLLTGKKRVENLE